jgi:Tol biopolymer transport system component
MAHQSSSSRRTTIGWLITLAFTSACGSGVVDVGDAPDSGGDDDPGGLTDDGSSLLSEGCTLQNLNQYGLVFDSDDGRLERRIYSMRADGSDRRPLTPVGELAREPALSPDGTQLAYVTPEGVKLLDLATGQSELVAAYADQPTWSADGTLLSYRWFDSSIRVVQPSDGSLQTDLVCYLCSAPALTPDGGSVVFSAIDENSTEGRSTLQTVSRFEGVEGKLLVPGSRTRITNPTVSPDSAWVAAAYDCGEQPSLWVTPLAVTTAACEGRRVTDPDAPRVTNPQWGPDVLIAYERGEPPRDLALVAADTGDECVLQLPGDDRNPNWGQVAIGVPE